MQERILPKGALKQLKGDLKGEIEIQPEVGHVDYISFFGLNDHSNPFEINPGYRKWAVYVIDTPREAIPDDQRRSAARDQLQGVYDTTSSLLERYQVGRALGISRLQIFKDHRTKK